MSRFSSLSSSGVNVALLAEGVGRNFMAFYNADCPRMSPSSRRAWVEIMISISTLGLALCRPPRGGRG